MKQLRYKRKKIYGKGGDFLIRPTLNQGRVFVGEGLKKLKYKRRPILNKGRIFVGNGLNKKKKTYKKKKVIYGKGALSAALLATSLIPSLFG